MKKRGKYLLMFLGIVVLLVLIDVISIYTRFKPIFAIHNENDYVYRGVLYDSYVCPQYTVPILNLKGNKYSCFDRDEIVSIIDKTKK